MSLIDFDCASTGVPGNADGQACTTAQFNEPVGLAFAGKTAVVSSFGGVKCGHVSLVTSVDFGSQYMQACDRLYKAQGYVHQRVKSNDAVRQELRGDQSFAEALLRAQQGTQFFQDVCQSRRSALSRVTEGPEGTPSTRTVTAMVESVRCIEEVEQVRTSYPLASLFYRGSYTHALAKECHLR